MQATDGQVVVGKREKKKRKTKHFFFFLSSWPEKRPNGFQRSAIRGRTPAVFSHSCDSSNETLIWLTHPSWCHGGGLRNYTPPQPELYKNPHTPPHTHTGEEEEEETRTHTKEVTIKFAHTRTRASGSARDTDAAGWCHPAHFISTGVKCTPGKVEMTLNTVEPKWLCQIGARSNMSRTTLH